MDVAGRGNSEQPSNKRKLHRCLSTKQTKLFCLFCAMQELYLASVKRDNSTEIKSASVANIMRKFHNYPAVR